VKTIIKIGLLATVQILVIIFAAQFLISEDKSSHTDTFVQQTINQIHTKNFSQIEKFDFETNFTEVHLISNVNIFMIINSISVLALIFGIVTITRIETKKKVTMEKLSIVGKLAARVAHDMRNPLSIIQMTLENIKMSHNIDEKEQKQFDKIESAIFRITHQIDDVLDFVKMSVVKKEYHSLKIILEDSIQKINIPSNIQVKFPQNDCKILCDRNKMLIVFVNIISNAVQDLKNMGIIRISFDLDVNWTTIKIEDNGNGIEPKMLNKIFDPLVTTKQTGTGLGLSSCKSIIESHDGVISACNGPEKGTIFSIRIPS